jgi:hypothetical protein
MERALEPEKLSILEEAGAGWMPHSRRSLLEHLLGVRALLEGWRARPALLDAGLFHAVYGTEFFEREPLGPQERDRVRAAIGDEAERLAHLWGALQRRTLADNVGRAEGFTALLRAGGEPVPLSKADLSDLVTLWVADTLEQVDRLGGRTRHQPELYSLRSFAAAPARLALERVFADRPFAKSP